MASATISILLHYCLLVLILAQCTHSATMPKPKNANAAVEHKPEPSSSHTYVVQTNHLARPSQFATLGRWYASMVATHSPRAATNSSSRIMYTYDTVMHGFAVRLTDEEAGRMARAPGVSGVYKDRAYYTQTTRSTGFMGLHEEFGAWPDSEFGDGVIIGFVDSGIWPESASFNDSGLGPVRPTWKGKCVDAEGFNASSVCSNKLVGAKVFTEEPDGALTPRDKDGHGSHVASTAAGSVVPGASLFEFSRGTARGVAPKARVAMYKACDKTGSCYPSGIVAAIDAAVSDGVDVLSMSLGGASNLDLYDDIVAVATFGAQRRGVFVVLAGGNEGPEESSVTNVAPWMTTVGAATTDRLFPATLKLGNGVVLSGQSLYTMASHGVSMIPLVYSACDETEMTPENVMGKLAVCDHGAREGGVQSGIYAQRAGGAGIVDVAFSERFSDAVSGETFTLPGVTLSYNEFKKLGAYVASVPYPVASFGFTCDTVTGENRAPAVVGFSSRGPNTVVPEILKPDVIAPGVNVLAAWSGDASPSGSEDDPRRVEYNIISGTSMACPHVAGAAALIKKRHGDWTPAMVRSALMTTATPLDMDGRVILDYGGGNKDAIDDDMCKDAGPLATGAGLILPRLAMDPGLVYDAGTQDYVDLLCTLNYTTEQMRRFVPGMTGCARTLPGGAANLNYPSMVVIFDGRTRVRTLTRTVTKVSAEPETYNVTVAAPQGVMVTVTPATLEFKRQNEKRSYTIEFRSEAAKPAGVWDLGHVVWENRKHRVRSPVAFLWDN